MEISQKFVAFSEYMNTYMNNDFFFIVSKKKLLSLETLLVNFIYSEKATKFCKITTVDLSYVEPVKSTVEILQNFMTLLRFDYFNLKSV